DPSGVLPDAVHGVEEAGLVAGVTQVARVARLAPRLQERAVGGVLVYSTVAVAVGNVDLATRRHRDVGWMVEGAGRMPNTVRDGQPATRGERPCRHAFLGRVARVRRLVALAERQAVLALLVELEDKLRTAI